MELSRLSRTLAAICAAVALLLLFGPVDLNRSPLASLAHVESSTSGVAHGLDDASSNHSHPNGPWSFAQAPRRWRRDSSDKPLTEEQKQEAFQKYRCRGQKLLAHLRDPSKAAKTAFTKFSDLDDWGWRINPYGSLGAGWYTDNLKLPLDSIGASKDVPPNVEKRWSHNRATTHIENGHDVVYKLTGAHYYNVFNAKDGVIIAYENWGPRYEVTGSADGVVPEDSPLPKLSQWSDVVYLTWESLTDDQNRSGLKHIFRDSTVNKESCAVGELGARSKGIASGVIKSYPGLKFERSKGTAEQDVFEALVGSPNVNGIAWLFIQHAQALGHKTIKSITVWDATPGDEEFTIPDYNKVSEVLNMWIEMAPVAEVQERRRARL